jgi:hypothetical protein
VFDFRNVLGGARVRNRPFNCFSATSCNAATVKMKGYLVRPLNDLDSVPDRI